MVTNNKPQIRFKGFNDEWEQRKLQEILKVNSGRDYKHLGSGSIPVYGTGGYMLSVNDKLSDKDAIGIGRKGTIDKPQYLKAPFWTVDTLFFMTPLNNFDLQFLYTMTQKINWKKMDESTGVPSLSKAVIEKVNQNIPSYQEQIIIGRFFKQLDNTFALHQRKLELLKEQKKGFLQKMFPKKGEKIPEIRFKGFSEEWEEAKLGELSEITSGEFLIKSKQDSKGKYPVFNGGTTNTGYSVLKNKSSKGDGDIVISSRGSAGSINIVTGGYWLGNSCFSLKENKVPIKTYFLFMALNHNNFSKYIHIGTIPSISKKNIEEHKIKLPKSQKEQELIGNYFKDLDTQISNLENKLDIYKQFKKAMLQKMFV